MTALNTNFSGGNSLSGYRSKTIYDSSTNAPTTIAASGAISFSTFRGKRALAPPGAIATAPVITLMTTSGATVTWSVSASATSYYLYIGTAVGGSQLYAADTGSATTTATITATFVVNTSYFPSVYGKNGALTGTPNQNATGYIVCAAPINVALTVSSLTSWTITWTAASNATGYSWALSTSSTNATSLSSGTVTGNTTVTSGAQTTALSSSTQYYAFVYATRTESKSAYGSGTYTTPAPPTVTAAVPTVTGNTITYTWTVSGASSFTVTLYKTTSTAASGGSFVVTATSGTSATFTMTSSGFYYITITAQNSIAVTATATSASALSATFTAPPTPRADKPAYSSPAYTELANGAAFPAAGAPITLINTVSGSVIYFLIITYTVNNVLTYFTAEGNSGINPNMTYGGKYTAFSIPNNITSFGVQATNDNFSQVIKLFTNSSGLIVFSNPNSSRVANSIVSVNTGGPSLTYSWGTSSGTATSYTVNLYAVGNATALATLTNTTATSASYTPVDGTTYYTTVAATNAGGTSTAAQSDNFAYVAPPVATAATPTVAAAPYTRIIDGGAYPAYGTKITVINTGTANWINLTIYLKGNYNNYPYAPYDYTYNTPTPPGGTRTFILPNAATGGDAFEVITSDGTNGTDVYFSKNASNKIVASAYNSDPANILSVNTGGPLLTYTWGISSGTATGYTVNLYAVGNATALATLTNTTATSATFTPVSGTAYYTTVVAKNATTGDSVMVTSNSVAA